jgi:hypothetical protein
MTHHQEGANPSKSTPDEKYPNVQKPVTKSSDPPVFPHQIPPPKESMKVLRESLPVDEDTRSGAVRHSSWVTGLHILVVR